MTFDLATDTGERECSACGEPESLGHAESCPRGGFTFLEWETMQAARTVYDLTKGRDMPKVRAVFDGHPTLSGLGWNCVDLPADPKGGTVDTTMDDQRLMIRRKAHPRARETLENMTWPRWYRMMLRKDEVP